MKRLFVAFALVALFAVAAFAGVQDFGKFTVDVPEGWTASQDGETVAFLKNDNTASASVTVAETEGASLKELADAFVEALGGKNLQPVDGTFTFEFTNENGVVSKAVLSGDDKNYALFVMTGIENAPNDFDTIINSLTEK
ncbi:MAG: hypothetical protein IJU31_06760 [Synergistaceae bacterium]|nr:hypothetical protein [Synergistaceae bacterium]